MSTNQVKPFRTKSSLPPSLPDEGYVRLPQVLAVIPVSKSTWWAGCKSGRYLFTADGMREALKGFDFNRALDVLQEAGALPVPGADGKRAKSMRIGGRLIKLYPVQTEKLGDNHA